MLISLLRFCNYSVMSNNKLVSVNFEVFGKVQGVFFRKYTEQQANKLKLRGWCMNTERGTVQGVVEGDPGRVKDMKSWLRSVGSPSSRIDKAEFSDEQEISKFTFERFEIRR